MSSERPRLRVDPNDVYSLARWLASRRFNRDGADKTFVLECLENMRRFADAARKAERVAKHD